MLNHSMFSMQPCTAISKMTPSDIAPKKKTESGGKYCQIHLELVESTCLLNLLICLFVHK